MMPFWIYKLLTKGVLPCVNVYTYERAQRNDVKNKKNNQITFPATITTGPTTDGPG